MAGVAVQLVVLVLVGYSLVSLGKPRVATAVDRLMMRG